MSFARKKGKLFLKNMNFVADNEFLHMIAFEYLIKKNRFWSVIGSSGRCKRLGHKFDTLFAIYHYDSAKLKGGGETIPLLAETCDHNQLISRSVS